MIEDMIILIVSVFAAVITYIYSIEYKQGPVLASAATSLIVGLFFYFFPLHPVLSKSIPTVFFGSSFVGMSSSRRVPDKLWVAVGGLIFGIFYLHGCRVFAGYGGGLGTTACMSVLITIGLMSLLNKVPLKMEYR